jgi:hypothetical protein
VKQEEKKMKIYTAFVTLGLRITLVVVLVMLLKTASSFAGEITEEGTAAPESAEEQYERGLGYYNGGFGVPKTHNP